MARNNADFHGSINVPISEVEEFIPSDYDDGDRVNPIRMKHIDSESCINFDSHDDDYVDRLADDIAKQGIKTPIEATRLNNGETLLTEGHHRVMAARQLGMTHIPVVFK